MTLREFLGLTCGTLILLQISGAPLAAQGKPGHSLSEFGADPHSGDAAATTAAFLAALAATQDGRLEVPSGEYLLDNSAGPIRIHQFAGELVFHQNARLVFVNNTQGGLLFIGGSNARIRGLRAAYRTPATERRSPNEEIKFSETTDTVLEQPTVEGGPSVGILFYNCVRPVVRNAVVRHTMADGLHFANCENAQVTGLTTSDTGDDGLAFVNYSIYPNKTGGRASDIHVSRSKARGIAVAGQSHVSIRDFAIDGTSASGLLCATDHAYQTRIPEDVRFEHGTVVNAGTVTPLVGNQFGIEYNDQTSCTFSDIEVRASAGRGVSGQAPQGRINIENVRVFGNLAHEAFSFYRTAQVNITGSKAEKSAGAGFVFLQCPEVTAADLSATNVSLRDPLHRAFWFENGRHIAATGLTVVDTQAKPTGDVVGAAEAPGYVQGGEVAIVSERVAHGKLAIQNGSSGLQFRSTNH